VQNRAEVVGNVADQVLQKYKHDDFEFVRMIFGKELRPFQWEWWFLMDEHADVLVKACPRVGKTVDIALKNLKDALTNPHEEVGVFAPKHDQSVNSFKPAFEIIESQEVVKAFIKRNAIGKLDYSKSYVNFLNHSAEKCFGVNSNFEGENVTILHVDELDDIPPDAMKRIFGRTVGKNRNGLPTRKRLSGVIWGKLNIWKFDQDPSFFTLPPVDVYQALAGGYLDLKSVQDSRTSLTDDEWLRTMCLLYVESRNFIWSTWLHTSQLIGLRWNICPIPPLKETKFRKRGSISFGLDMGHQGGGADASEYSLQVTEAVGQYERWLFGRNWSPDTDPDQLIGEICDYWEFFNPDIGFGDALDANLIAQINEELYRRGLTYYNWHLAGKNDQEGWKDWARHGLMTPIHNSGRTKHYMYMSLRNAIYNSMNISDAAPTGRIFVFPLVDREKSKKSESWRELQMLISELSNLVAEKMPSGFYKIQRYKKKIDDPELQIVGGSRKLGDDRPDALAMSHYGLDYVHSGTSAAGGVGLAYARGF